MVRRQGQPKRLVPEGVLDHHITTNLRERIGSAPSNFSQQLPAPDSDLARETVKDPYVFDFLTLTERAPSRP